MGYRDRKRTGIYEGDPDFDLGARIRKLRTERGISQPELAALLGVYQKDISRWEHNVRTPNAYMLKMMCEVMQASADEMLDIHLG